MPPVRISNSARLRSLIRAGTIYLTTQDAIALALENNLDIEVARYNPLIAHSQLVRFEAGGALPGVPSGAAQAGTVASGQGVAGSQAAVGVSISGATAGKSSSVNATISQVGPVVQTLDPIFSDVSTFSHTSIPQPNTIQSQVLELISNTRVYNVTLQQGYLLGGSVTANYTEHYLNENAPSDLLNPSTAPNASISVQQNLLNGFGVAVNSRNIRVAKINLATSDLNFRTQVNGIVSQVLNLYYGLAADYEDQRAKKTALDVARQLYHDTSEQVRVGTLAPLDQTTAESQVASSERDLVDSETALAQQEVQLKSVLSRTAMRDPLVAAAHIVPVDPIVVPEADNLPPVDQLVRQALASRTDLASEKAGIETSESHPQARRMACCRRSAALLAQARPGCPAFRAPSSSTDVRQPPCPISSAASTPVWVRCFAAIFQPTTPALFSWRRLQPPGPGGLWNRPDSASAIPALVSEGPERGAGGRDELRHRHAPGPRPL